MRGSTRYGSMRSMAGSLARCLYRARSLSLSLSLSLSHSLSLSPSLSVSNIQVKISRTDLKSVTQSKRRRKRCECGACLVPVLVWLMCYSCPPPPHTRSLSLSLSVHMGFYRWVACLPFDSYLIRLFGRAEPNLSLQLFCSFCLLLLLLLLLLSWLFKSNNYILSVAQPWIPLYIYINICCSHWACVASSG